MGVMELFDICVNLAKPRFDADRDEVVARARAAGVAMMAVTGADAEGSDASAALARRHGFVATAGVHPHHAEEWPAAAPAIRELLARPEVRAVGECGLDFDRMRAPAAAQEAAFEAQIGLAFETGLPLFLHERAATGRMLEMLEAAGRDLPPAVLHCFTGGPSEAEAYLARGLYLGVTGWVCDERRGDALRAAIPRIPAGRLMLETDAPFLYPRDMPKPEGTAPAGKPSRQRNEPAFLPHIAARVADLRDEAPETTARHARDAAMEFFRLDRG